jgi:hypothetical protein
VEDVRRVAGFKGSEIRLWIAGAKLLKCRVEKDFPRGTWSFTLVRRLFPKGNIGIEKLANPSFACRFIWNPYWLVIPALS